MTHPSGTQGPQVITHVVAEPADVLIISADARLLAAGIGFSAVEEAEIGLVARELATNILKHAGNGAMTVRVEPPRLTIIASDSGPGIPSIDEALADGFSSVGSLGYGLGTVNRLMDHVDIDARTGRGLTVTAHRSVRATPDVIIAPPVDIGVATAPKPGYIENGDGYIVRHGGSKTLVGVFDGVGHGAPAQAAAQAAFRYIDSHAEQPMQDIFRGVGIACRGTRGVVLALARFDWDAQTLEFASVGNIEARVFNSAAPMRFIVRRGILGASAPAPKVSLERWPANATLVLFSDGVASHWGDVTLPRAGESTAAATARALLARLNRHTDDATLLIVQPRVDA